MFTKFKFVLLAILVLFSLAGCSQSISVETKPYDEVKKETESYSFKGNDQIEFNCAPGEIKADEVYTLTMNKTLNTTASEEDGQKMKNALIRLFDIPAEEQTDMDIKIRKAGDAFVSYKDDFLYGSIYPNCSTFLINHIENMKAVPDYNIYTTEYSTYSYSRGDYPKEELNMADGSSLRIDKAISDADKYIGILSDANMFDDGETVKLSRIAVNKTENGSVLILHYNQVRYGLEVDDGGAINGEDNVDMMRDPFFEVVFVGDDKPSQLRNSFSDGVMKKDKVEELLGIAEAEKVMIASLAEGMKATVLECALRYCCIQRTDTENHIYRPMWCFVITEYKEGASAFVPFPRVTVYVDAVSGDTYYCDSSKFLLEKNSTEK